MTVTTMPASTPRHGGCGCAGGGQAGSGGCRCGGSPALTAAAFTRPRFFAGQLLTEDDLQLLIAYVTGKDRLRNRLLFGPGVVSGLEVFCAPCGGGEVVVTPGYAFDCCGNEIVVGCAETVPVTDLVHEMRVRGLGVDCGDPCAKPDGAPEDGTDAGRNRRYGLYIRYAETDAEPVAPYATQEPCGPVGCVPSRVREGFSLLVKCPPEDAPDHRYRPGDALRQELGDRTAFTAVWSRGRRLDRYRERLCAAARADGKRILFGKDDAARFTSSHADLSALLEGTGAGRWPAVDRRMTETVRTLAAAVARFDTYDEEGQQQLLTSYPDLSQVGAARSDLGRACEWLAATVDDSGNEADGSEPTWSDVVQRGVARAVISQTRTQVLPEATPTAMELRLLALGAPLDRPLRSDLRTDLSRLREWLLIRLETSTAVTTCDLRGRVARIQVPQPLPPQADGDDGVVGRNELQDLSKVASAIYAALYRYLTDTVCASLLPPPLDCVDTDVLLATIEIDGCSVVRVCATDREQVLPGGAAYSAWLSRLDEVQDLAGRVCCGQAPEDTCTIDPAGDVHLPYVPGWLSHQPDGSDLGRLLRLVRATASAAPSPAARPEAATTQLPARSAAVPDGVATRDGSTTPSGSPMTPEGIASSDVAALREELAAVTARLADVERRAHLAAAGSPAGPPTGAVPATASGGPTSTPAPIAAPAKKTAAAKKAAAKKTTATRPTVAERAAPPAQAPPAQAPAAEAPPAEQAAPGPGSGSEPPPDGAASDEDREV